jgi:hypothetical protein
MTSDLGVCRSRQAPFACGRSGSRVAAVFLGRGSRTACRPSLVPARPHLLVCDLCWDQRPPAGDEAAARWILAHSDPAYDDRKAGRGDRPRDPSLLGRSRTPRRRRRRVHAVDLGPGFIGGPSRAHDRGRIHAGERLSKADTARCRRVPRSPPWGVYLRSSLKAGPFRFNLSKSGIGVSAGVPGFRVGTGPRGNYVRIGRGGLPTVPPSRPSGRARTSLLSPARADGSSPTKPTPSAARARSAILARST